MRHGKLSKLDLEFVKETVRTNYTKSGIAAKLGLTTSGSSYVSLFKYCAENKIDLSHLRGKQNTMISLDSLNKKLVENSKCCRGQVKVYLIRFGILKNECSICKCPPVWQERPMTLIIDHINGVNNDYRVENLRLLCPNCNSQTDTFAGRNVKRKLMGNSLIGKTTDSDSVKSRFES